DAPAPTASDPSMTGADSQSGDNEPNGNALGQGFAGQLGFSGAMLANNGTARDNPGTPLFNGFEAQPNGWDISSAGAGWDESVVMFQAVGARYQGHGRADQLAGAGQDLLDAAFADLDSLASPSAIQDVSGE